MAYETIRIDVAENIQTITLHRPEKLNAFTRQMMQELIHAFGAADADDSVRAVIVTGAGRAFCAGADLSSGAGTFERSEATGRPQPRLLADGRVDYSDVALRDGGGRVTLRIFECLKPVIGAINGPAVGIGATMLLPMDVRIRSVQSLHMIRTIAQRLDRSTEFFPERPHTTLIRKEKQRAVHRSIGICQPQPTAACRSAQEFALLILQPTDR
jgi:enoyl-CoA hydratase/carnithine racemase